jgi:hypothetical protein
MGSRCPLFLVFHWYRSYRRDGRLWTQLSCLTASMDAVIAPANLVEYAVLRNNDFLKKNQKIYFYKKKPRKGS